MSWREELRPGSFRGARFFLDSAERGGGRKLAVHEYPRRDMPYAEDLGRASRSFSIDAYVIGESYFHARDKLIEALEAEGPGTLVHPFQGHKQVAVIGYRLRESKDEGGLARFSIDFIETLQKAAEPRARQDFLSRVVSAADGAVARAREAFLEVYDVVGQAQFAVDSMALAIGDAGQLIRQAVGGVLTGPQAVADFSRAVDGFIDDAESLARAPEDFAAKLNQVFGSGGKARSRRDAVSAYLRVSRFTATPLGVATTATRLKEQRNQDALVAFVRQRALVEAARIAPSARFTSFDEAIEIRDQILDGLDGVAETATDAVFGALGALRAELVKAVPGDDNALPRLLTIAPPITLPAVVLVYDLYESLALEDDVIARNKIRHPGFVPGGVPLKVLSRAAQG